MKVESSTYTGLSDELRRRLDDAAQAEFGQFALVRETTWARPNWTFLGYEEGDLAAFYNLVEREVRIDGVTEKVAGLNNLITLPAWRGRGFASRLLEKTESIWFGTLGARYGLLLCADALLPFYTRFGWQRLDAIVRYQQPQGQQAWAANCMILSRHRQEVSVHDIDLCGLPW